MPCQRPQPGVPGRICGLLGLWLSLLLMGAIVGHAPEAAAATGKSSSKKQSSKKKKSSKKKSVASKPRPVQPLSREVDGPTGITSGGELEEELEGEDPDSEADGGSPESQLEAIERELLAQPPDPTPALVELPPVVSDPAPIDGKPGWTKHRVIPFESLADIAARYQVDEKDVRKWNNLKGEKPRLAAGKELRIRAVNPPLPRERVEHVAKKGDSYESVAKEYDVDVEQLKRWNSNKLGPKLTAKEKVVLWREQPPLIKDPGAGLAAKLAQIRVPSGGISIGKPSRGRLVRGVELPDRPDLYTRRKPEESYGSTHAISQLMAAIVRFRHETGFRRSIVIGGISRARGGRFRPHKSHQSGRDIDIRLPVVSAAERKHHITASDIDWRATWQLIHAFILNGEVEYIFLDYGHQKRLYKEARAAGVSAEQLTKWIQWPVKKPKHQIIRHVDGHRSHFHVRVRCADSEKHCITSR